MDLNGFEWNYSLLPTLFKWYHHVYTKPMGIFESEKFKVGGLIWITQKVTRPSENKSDPQNYQFSKTLNKIILRSHTILKCFPKYILHITPS